MTRIAIIGAGLSGLIAARELQPHAEVTLFEKSRGVSGRMATRYADPYQFDHGTQFFTAKTQAFQRFLAPLIEQGIIARWDARFVEIQNDEITARRSWDAEYPHYVGMPKMNAIGKYLAKGLDLRLQTRLERIEQSPQGWQLTSDSQEAFGCYDWIICTAPAAQTAELMPDSFCYKAALHNTKMLACFALMLGFETPLPMQWDAALIGGADISWISVNSSKPGRPEGFSLLVNATNKWAEAYFHDDRDAVTAHLLAETARTLWLKELNPDHTALHAWKYANLPKQNGMRSYIDFNNKLAACGDWCIQGRVEAAFTSAMHLSEQLKEELAPCQTRKKIS